MKQDLEIIEERPSNIFFDEVFEIKKKLLDCRDEKVEKRCLKRLDVLAKNGNMDACDCLTEHYLFGKKDFKTANEWINYGILHQHHHSYFYKAKCLEHGWGVKQNEVAALSVYETLSKMGKDYATFALANCYYLGKGTGPNVKKAFEIFFTLAQKGKAHAQLKIAHMYFAGFGVKQNGDQAVYWATEAIKNGNKRAYYLLGECYYYGKGVQMNHEKALRLYRTALKYHDKEAFVRVGICYYKGNGVKRNTAKAYNLLRRGAQKGSTKAEQLKSDIFGEEPQKIDMSCLSL